MDPRLDWEVRQLNRTLYSSRIVVGTPPLHIALFTDSTIVALPAVPCCHLKYIKRPSFFNARGQFSSCTIKNAMWKNVWTEGGDFDEYRESSKWQLAVYEICADEYTREIFKLQVETRRYNHKRTIRNQLDTSSGYSYFRLNSVEGKDRRLKVSDRESVYRRLVKGLGSEESKCDTVECLLW